MRRRPPVAHRGTITKTDGSHEMHPMQAEQFAAAELAERHREAQRRRMMRSVRPPRRRQGGAGRWWRRDRT